MKSGMLAAEAAFTELTSTSAESGAAADLAAYEDALKASWVWEELERERNIRPSYASAASLHLLMLKFGTL